MKNLKKVFLVIVLLLIITGCGDMMDTPTKKVESLLSKYQTEDKEVLDQLDKVVDEAGTLNKKQQEKYRNLMKKQYQNLSYKIKNVNEDGDNATVVVELTVYDYGKAISDSEKYLANNRNEFILDTENDIIDNTKYLDYKIENMSNTKDKVTYTINFTLVKEDDNWKLNNLSDIDRLKLHGLYY